MRLLLQRVKEASVTVAGERVAAIGPGLLIFAGFGKEDVSEQDLSTQAQWHAVLDKIPDLRIFPDADDKMNLSLRDWQNGTGELLIVSQFTLYANCRKGRRPSFDPAAPPAQAETWFKQLIAAMAERLPGRVQSGIFGADMDIALCNWGPVTLWLDSRDFA